MYEEYAKTIGEVFAREFPDGEVQLITENGTPIVSTSMSLLATIIGKKVIRGKTMLVVDCKRDDVGFVCHTKNPPCNVLSNDSDYVEHATITDVPVLRMILSIVIIPVQLILVIRFLFLMLELMVVMLPMTL